MKKTTLRQKTTEAGNGNRTSGDNEKETSFGNFLPDGYILNNQYKIEYLKDHKKVIGQGGFGIIYKAKDLKAGGKLDGYVAIKEFMPKGYAQRISGAKLDSLEEYIEGTNIFKWAYKRFKEEANITHACKHTNVVSIRQIFEENNTLYMVMEYIDGITLRKYSKNKDFFKALPNIVEQTLKAVEHVHKKGYFHRDITPDNIMIQVDGTVKLIDFGAFSHHDIKIGKVSKLIVTEGFSPPERGRNDKDEDASSDIYSLAATFYTLITGKPFDEYEMDKELSQLDKNKYNPCFIEALKQALKHEQSERPKDIKTFRDIIERDNCKGKSFMPKILVLLLLVGLLAILGYYFKDTLFSPKGGSGDSHHTTTTTLKKFKNNNFSFNYPNSFKVVEENNQMVKLINKNNTKLTIDIQGGTLMSSSLEELYKISLQNFSNIIDKEYKENSFYIYNASKYKYELKKGSNILRVQAENIDDSIEDIKMISESLR